MSVHDIRGLIDKAAPELKARGVSAIYLFGSEAKGRATADSDIDLAFDVAEEANLHFSLIDQADLQLRLQDLFGRKVDFFERSALLRRFGPRLEPELIKLL